MLRWRTQLLPPQTIVPRIASLFVGNNAVIIAMRDRNINWNLMLTIKIQSWGARRPRRVCSWSLENDERVVLNPFRSIRSKENIWKTQKLVPLFDHTCLLSPILGFTSSSGSVGEMTRVATRLNQLLRISRYRLGLSRELSFPPLQANTLVRLQHSVHAIHNYCSNESLQMPTLILRCAYTSYLGRNLLPIQSLDVQECRVVSTIHFRSLE